MRTIEVTQFSFNICRDSDNTKINLLKCHDF